MYLQRNNAINHSYKQNTRKKWNGIEFLNRVSDLYQQLGQRHLFFFCISIYCVYIKLHLLPDKCDPKMQESSQFFVDFLFFFINHNHITLTDYVM